MGLYRFGAVDIVILAGNQGCGLFPGQKRQLRIETRDSGISSPPKYAGMWSLGRRRGQDRHHFHEPNRGAAGPACPSGFGPVDPNHEFSWFLIYLDAYSARMKHAVLIFLLALPAFAQSTAPLSTTTKPAKIFDEVADSALALMTKRAEELKIHGAAVVAFIEGDVTQSWS